MAKRTTKAARDPRPPAAAARQSAPTDAMEQRILAFAKQAGYVAGTIQTKAEGLMDRKALTKQLVSVRDGAAHLLEQLGRVAGKARRTKAPSRAARKTTRARSGGAVDAPGKTHRKRAPADPDAALARSQAGKVRAAMPMEKTPRYRVRG